MANKIKYNLKNVHYAPITSNDGDSVTFGTPVHIPGAVSLSMEPQGEISKFYADGIVFWQGSANNGYEGDLEMAMFPDGFRIDVLGDELDAKNVLIENTNATPTAFALMFEFDGDDKAIRYCLYNCLATRQTIEGSTKEDSIEPQTETCTISASPLPNGDIRAKTGPDTDTTAYNNWYSAVPVRTAA